jgi:hypothetical protein
MGFRVAQTNFTGGEINNTLSARYDLNTYKSSARHLENFIPELHGPISRRAGSYFLEDLGSPAVLIPFKFSSDPTQNFILVFQNQRLRIADANGFIRVDGEPLELDSPYLEGQLYDLGFAQSGDVVYLAHFSHRLRKLARHGNTDWRLEQVSFVPEIVPPASVTVAFTGSAGSYNIRYKVNAVNEQGRVSRAALGQQPAGQHPNDWLTGDYATVSWPAVAGAVSYNVYREDGGIYGLIGVVDSEASGTIKFRDDKYRAETSDTPPEPLDPFVEGNNPSVVCFHQQRLILASPYLEPQKWYGSRTGNFEDFSKSKPLKDDDSLEYTLASGNIDTIQWVVAFGDLLIGTAGSEYKAIGPDQGVITPTSLNVREQSYWGSVKLRPLVMGNSVLHVQRQGNNVRDLYYSLETDGYKGNDLSIMAPSLFEGHVIRQWDYQQTPGSRIWCVRSDGLILVLVYLKEHDIWSWSRVGTQGKYRSVAVIAGSQEDTVYAVVEREVGGQTRFFLERFMPKWREELDGIKEAFFVDCGLSTAVGGEPVSAVSGLDHLEGCLVDILADGSVIEPRRVEGGKVELDFPASRVHVGLNYRSLFAPQTPEADLNNGSTLGRVRNYSGETRIRLLSSVGGSYGPTAETEHNFQFLPVRYDEPVEPFTGDYQFLPDGDYSGAGALWLAQNYPLPFTISALVLDVDYQG